MSKASRTWVLVAGIAAMLAAPVYDFLSRGRLTLLGVVLLVGALLLAIGLVRGSRADVPSPSRRTRVAIMIGVAIVVAGLVLVALL